MNNMKILYEEMMERMKYLESVEKKSSVTDGRIAELQLAIVRVQQILLSEINK